MNKLVKLFLALVLMTSCNSKESKPNNRNLLQTDWQLDKIDGEILNGTMTIPTLKIDLGEMRFSGNSGCNTYTGNIIAVDTESIEIGNIAVTFKLCHEANYEDQYLRRINQIKTYEVSETNLYFKNNKTEVILEYTKVNSTKKTRIHDIWSAVRIDGFPINRMATIPRLEINTQDMKIYGNDGCNDYFASIVNLSENKISFGGIGSTRKMCQNMEIPERYVNALNKTNHYKFEDKFLILFDSENNEILAFMKGD